MRFSSLLSALRARRSRAAAKLCLALLLATGASLFLATSDSATERLALSQVVQSRTQAQVDRVGVAAIGGVYLADPTNVETASVNRGALNNLERGLDPALTDGGLYPLRKGVEQLAGFLAFVLAAVSMLHAMITGGAGGSAGGLQKWVMNFLCVWLLLWAYPAWDYLVYKQLSKSIVMQLEEGKVAKSVTDRIMNKGSAGSTAIAAGDALPAGSSPLAELNRMNQNEQNCHMLMSQGNNDRYREGQRRCLEKASEFQRRQYMQNFRTFSGGEPDEQAAFIESLDPANAGLMRSALEKVKGWGRGIVALNETINNLIVGGVEKLISATLGGIIWGITTIVGAAVLWLVSLATVVARAISFAFAPIAIVWSLAPGRGLDNALKWFKGHAKISLWPVGLSFGLLIFYVINMAVVGTDWVTGAAPQGLAIKVALFLGMLTTCFKSQTFTNLIAGDIADVAADMGKGAANRTVQMAGTALKGAIVVGTAGAGAVAMGAMGAAGTAAGAGKLGMLGKGLSTLGSKAGTAAKGSGVMGKTLRGSMKAARFTKMAYDGGKKAYDGRVKSSELPSLQNPSLRPMMSSMASPFGKMVQDLEKLQKMRVAATDAQTARQLKADQSQRDNDRHVLREDFGITDVRPRQGERVDVDPSRVTPGPAMSAQAVSLGSFLVHAVVNGQQSPLTVTVSENGGVRSYAIDGESHAALQDLVQSNLAFREHVHAAAMKRYGSKDNIPMIAGPNGPAYDMAKLVQDDSDFANALAFASQASSMRENELARRELLSARLMAAGMPMAPDSAMEAAIRHLDPAVIQPVAGDVDLNGNFTGDYIVRVAGLAQAAMRPTLGLGPTDLVPDHLTEAGTFASMPAGFTADVQAVTQQQRQDLAVFQSHTVTKGGKRLGLKIEDFVRSGGQLETDPAKREAMMRYDGEADSRFDKALDLPGIAGKPDAHQLAYKHAMAEVRSSLPAQNPGESADAYRIRLNRAVSQAIFINTGS
jgi:hypothetical protein